MKYFITSFVVISIVVALAWLFQRMAQTTKDNRFKHGDLISFVGSNRLNEVRLMVLKYNKDPNVENDAGVTPLILATRLHYTEMIRVLIELGADPYMPGRDGKSALDVAREENCTDCYDALRGAK
jgi:ankyrin repeat protein